jgi:hypothetical protein
VEREEGHLDPHPDQDQDEGDLDHLRVGQVLRGDDLLDVDHVQAAGLEVEVAHAEQVERRADRPHDDVVEGGQGRPLALAHGDQRVAGQRGHLQEHVEVEGVAGEGHADQAGGGEEEQRVEQRHLVRELFVHPAGREKAREQGHRRDRHGDEAVDVVDPELDSDAPRSAPKIVPTAEEVLDLAALALDHLVERRGGRGERPDHGQQHQRQAQPLFPRSEQRHEHRTEQREEKNENRSLLSHRCFGFPSGWCPPRSSGSGRRRSA